MSISRHLSLLSYVFCVTKYHGYIPLIVNTSQIFPHSWLITGFVTRLTRRVPLVDKNCSPSGAPEIAPGFKWCSCYSIFSITCMFCRSLFVLFSFGHIVLSVLWCTILITPWYRQTVLRSIIVVVSRHIQYLYTERCCLSILTCG